MVRKRFFAFTLSLGWNEKSSKITKDFLGIVLKLCSSTVKSSFKKCTTWAKSAKSLGSRVCIWSEISKKVKYFNKS
jgi:hypothetical protein